MKNNTSGSSKDIIERFLNAENGRDWETWASFLHGNVTFEVIGSSRIIIGKENYINHMKSVYKELEDWSFSIIRILGDDTSVMVEFNGNGHFTGDFNNTKLQQVPLSLKSVCVFEIENNLIKKCIEYFDHQSYLNQLNSRRENNIE